MKMKMRFFRLVFFACVLLSIPAASLAAVTVSFQPQDTVIGVGETFSVDLLADMSNDTVLAWGLDVSFDPLVLALTGAPAIGPSWNPVPASDGDGLAGLAFPVPVTGPDVLLATLTFETLAPGLTGLSASATMGDLSEGFALLSGGFAQENFIDGSVNVVPLPATLLLFGSGLAGLFGLKRRKN